MLLIPALLLIGPAVHAQTDAFPSSPPPDLPVHAYQPPSIVQETLPNGLHVVIEESRRVPLVTAALGVRAGASADPAGIPGLSETVANLVDQGTSKYDHKKLEEAAKNLGGDISVSSARDFTAITGSALARNVDPLLSLMAQVTRQPKLSHDDLLGYLYTMEKRLTLRNQFAQTRARSRLAKALFGAHPYGTTDPTPAALRAMTPQAVRDFYEAHYRPNGAVLAIVGDIDAQDVLRRIQAAFGDWKRSNVVAKAVPAPTLLPWNRVYLVDRPGSVQSNVLVGNVTLKVSPQDAVALEVANALLGGKTDSRLFNSVRQKLGYAYAIQSDIDFDALAGQFTVAVECRTEVTAPTIKQILADVDTLGTQPVGAQELRDAQNYLAGKFVQALESQAGLVSELFEIAFYHKPADYLATYRDRVFAVTPADVERVTRNYILPGRAAIVVVGDASKLTDSLKDIGYIQPN